MVNLVAALGETRRLDFEALIISTFPGQCSFTRQVYHLVLANMRIEIAN